LARIHLGGGLFFARPAPFRPYLDTMTVLAKINRTVDEHKLLEKGDSVLVALSGGPDSVALLHILAGLKRKYRLKLQSVYINHNIRKRAAKKEEQFCQDICDRLKIDFHIISEDIPSLAKKMRKGVEEAARDFRYRTFEDLAARLLVDKIALGHHLDDRAETVLFRIIRGTGKTGLRGMPVRRDKFIRPLFDVTKDEILAYLRQHRLSYCLDQSNMSADYDRNYIRNRLLVEIRSHLNPAVDRALINLSETAGEDEAFLDEYVAARLRRSIRKTVGGKIELDLNRFNRYDKWLRRRLLRHCLTELSTSGLAPDRAVVDRLDEFCRSGRKSLSVPEKLQAVLADDKLVIFRRGPHSYAFPLSAGSVCRLTTLGLDIRMSVYDNRRESLVRRRRSRSALLDYDRVQPPLTVRNIRPGDRFPPLGLRGTKKIGDYLTDRKVHTVYRDEIPVVCDAEGIIWLVGYEIADRVKIDESTRKVLRIEFSRRKGS